jgi:hypothetical protein
MLIQFPQAYHGDANICQLNTKYIGLEAFGTVKST